jgi:hypothetical protein
MYRWYGIPLADRTCTFCDTGKLVDEFNFISECKAIPTLRKEFFAPRYCRAPIIPKFIDLMTSSYLETLKTLCILISIIFEIVGCPP